MKVHTYERAFLAVGAGMLVIFGIALIAASVMAHISLPDHVAQLDPKEVRNLPPFDNPGVFETAPGRYQVVMLAAAWSFTPNEIRVPEGAEVTFLATSTDVIHGIHIEGTRVNAMLIPGQVARVTYTFREAGEYLMVCHEYCGLGHHIMSGKVIVE